MAPNRWQVGVTRNSIVIVGRFIEVLRLFSISWSSNWPYVVPARIRVAVFFMLLHKRRFDDIRESIGGARWGHFVGVSTNVCVAVVDTFSLLMTVISVSRGVDIRMFHAVLLLWLDAVTTRLD